MAVTRRRPGGSQRSVANATQTQRLWGRPQHPKRERTLASRSSAPDTPGVEVDRTGPGMRNGPRRRLLVSPGVYHPWSVSIRLFVRTHCPSVSHVSVCPSPRLSFICHLPVVCIHPVVRPPSALVGLYVHQVSAILVTAIRPSDRSSLNPSPYLSAVTWAQTRSQRGWFRPQGTRGEGQTQSWLSQRGPYGRHPAPFTARGAPRLELPAPDADRGAPESPRSPCQLGGNALVRHTAWRGCGGRRRPSAPPRLLPVSPDAEPVAAPLTALRGALDAIAGGTRGAGDALSAAGRAEAAGPVGGESSQDGGAECAAPGPPEDPPAGRAGTCEVLFLFRR